MKAVVLTGFGGKEVFQLKNLSQPKPGPGEVLVNVRATSVNLIDCRRRRDGYLTGVKLPAVLGCEVSGVIEATGPGVRKFHPGDEVFYSTSPEQDQGTYAEYHIAKESALVKKPAALSHIDAAGLPVNASHIWEALIVEGALASGETLLIRDGVDCLGIIAIQVAKIVGARVVLLCDKHQMAVARGMGADVILDRQAKDLPAEIARATQPAGVDVFLDTVGGADVSSYIAYMNQNGRMVGLYDMQIDPAAAAEKGIRTKLVRHHPDPARLEALLQRIEDKQIRTVVDNVMPLSAVGTAHQRMERGVMCGKVVLVPG